MYARASLWGGPLPVLSAPVFGSLALAFVDSSITRHSVWLPNHIVRRRVGPWYLSCGYALCARYRWEGRLPHTFSRHGAPDRMHACAFSALPADTHPAMKRWFNDDDDAYGQGLSTQCNVARITGLPWTTAVDPFAVYDCLGIRNNEFPLGCSARGTVVAPCHA